MVKSGRPKLCSSSSVGLHWRHGRGDSCSEQAGRGSSGEQAGGASGRASPQAGAGMVASDAKHYCIPRTPQPRLPARPHAPDEHVVHEQGVVGAGAHHANLEARLGVPARIAVKHCGQAGRTGIRTGVGATDIWSCRCAGGPCMVSVVPSSTQHAGAEHSMQGRPQQAQHAHHTGGPGY